MKQADRTPQKVADKRARRAARKRRHLPNDVKAGVWFTPRKEQRA
jgi:hypothetical protein